MQTPFDRLPYALRLILTILFDPIYQGINRIMRRRDDVVGVLVGVLWILTLGLFVVGWIVDIVTMILYKTIKLFA